MRAEQTRPTVLIVEDDLVVAQVLAQAVEIEGLHPVVAQHVSEAESLARIRPPVLVLTDLFDTPYGEGSWAPIAGLRRAAGRAPIIVCTAHSGATRENPAARGVADIVAKPFDLDDLLDRIRRALDSDGAAVGSRSA